MDEPKYSMAPERLDDAEFVVAKFLAGRQKLNSCVFTAQVNMSMDPAGDALKTGIMDCKWAVDFQKKLLRFEFKQTSDAASGKYVSRPDEAFLVTGDEAVMGIWVQVEHTF